MKEKRAVWTTKTQTSSSTPALSSTFFSLSISLPLSLFLPPRSLSFICRSERSPSRFIFHLAEGARVLVLSARNLPSLIPPQITIFLHHLYTESLFLLSFIHSPSLFLSLSHARAPMQPLTMSEVKDSKYHKFVFCH